MDDHEEYEAGTIRIDCRLCGAQMRPSDDGLCDLCIAEENKYAKAMAITTEDEAMPHVVELSVTKWYIQKEDGTWEDTCLDIPF